MGSPKSSLKKLTQFPKHEDRWVPDVFYIPSFNSYWSSLLLRRFFTFRFFRFFRNGRHDHDHNHDPNPNHDPFPVGPGPSGSLHPLHIGAQGEHWSDERKDWYTQILGGQKDMGAEWQDCHEDPRSFRLFFKTIQRAILLSFGIGIFKIFGVFGIRRRANMSLRSKIK